MSICYSDIMHHFHHSYASNMVNLYFKHLLYICHLMKNPRRTALSTTCGIYVRHTPPPQLICGLVRNGLLPQRFQLCANGFVMLFTTWFLSQNATSSCWNNTYYSDKICWKKSMKKIRTSKSNYLFSEMCPSPVSQSCRLLTNFSRVTRPTVATRTCC